MSNKVFAYARVSTQEQSLARQLDSLRKYVDDDRDIFTEKQSGKDLNRPVLQTLLNTVLREGDELYVHSLDRLGRNKEDIKNVLSELKKKNIVVHILDIPTTMVNYGEQGKPILEMVTNLLIEVIGFVAETERLNIRKRQEEGIKAAKERNVRFGRPVKELPESWENDYILWRHGKVTASALAKKYKWNRTTFYRKLKAYEQSERLIVNISG